jgi:hypothetical protein
VAGLFPMLSMVGQVTRSGEGPQGGPVVPDTMVKVGAGLVGKVPPEMMLMSVLIAVQLTGTDSLTGAGRSTVGWPEALLHSRTLPMALTVRPEADRVTLWPPVRLVDGLTPSVPAALASADSIRAPVPESISSNAHATTRERVRFPICPFCPHAPAAVAAT